jgi:hypothetical protein
MGTYSMGRLEKMRRETTAEAVYQRVVRVQMRVDEIRREVAYFEQHDPRVATLYALSQHIAVAAAEVRAVGIAREEGDLA